jgi:hypothetical protein
MGMPLAYDLHVHPGPSSVPRWGDGRRVWEAAREAGVRGFVWKSHEEHTAARCRDLPSSPVRPIASASLNSWADLRSIAAAIDDGAQWIWGPTTTADGQIGWDLPLPRDWLEIAAWLRERRPQAVLATGHLGPEGRMELARIAAEARLPCSVTHALGIPLDDALELARAGCALEIDAYTYVHTPPGRTIVDIAEAVSEFDRVGALVYFTSDGGQSNTGDPFVFADRVLGMLGRRLSSTMVRRLSIDGPVAMVEALEEAGR